MRQMLLTTSRLLVGVLLLLVVSACGTAPPSESVTVSVSVTGDGTGTVTSVPAGIEVASGDDAGTLELPPGTEIALTATADAGSSFGGWDGVCQGEGATCTVTIDVDTEITATFTLVEPNTLSVSVVAGGSSAGAVTSSPAGVDTAVGDLSADFAANSVVTLTAAATSGAFSGWVGGGCGDVKAPVCDVTMDADKDVIATFNDVQTQVVRVAAGGNDAVEFLGDSEAGQTFDPVRWLEGWVWVTINFLDLGWAPYHNLTETGIRFPEVSVPAGAIVSSATLQVTATAANVDYPVEATKPLSLAIRGELSLGPVGFVQPPVTETTFDITLRQRTASNVMWNITTSWISGTAYQAPDVSSIVQEIVDQPTWSSGNAVVLFLKGGTLDDIAYRRVHSFESGAPDTRHPTLIIEYAVMPAVF